MEFSIAELTLLGKSEPASLASQDMPCRVKGGGGEILRDEPANPHKSPLLHDEAVAASNKKPSRYVPRCCDTYGGARFAFCLSLLSQVHGLRPLRLLLNHHSGILIQLYP